MSLMAYLAEIAHYSSDDGISSLTNDYIFDIIRDSHGDLWMGSPLGQIFRYIESEKRFKPYSFQPVYAIEEFTPGNLLWHVPTVCFDG